MRAVFPVWLLGGNVRRQPASWEWVELVRVGAGEYDYGSQIAN
jgi:hypothetical protein